MHMLKCYGFTMCYERSNLLFTNHTKLLMLLLKTLLKNVFISYYIILCIDKISIKLGLKFACLNI
jgi:hypothetical protein